MRADLGQQLVVDDWAVAFVAGSPGALMGTIDFHVDGRLFPFERTMVYDDSKYADPKLHCPQ